MTRIFWYSQTGQSLNLRKKVASQYGVSNAFLPETTTFKEICPKLECKSSAMIAKNEKMTPKLVAPLPIFWKFNPPCSEIGDGTKL